ncbi:MAG: glycosyl transferase, partial [Thermoleophilaceae bacterium]|nr:glycosyl transferase [Thermoleophilaceae bacterium]
PVVACPAAGDMGENAARVSWAGAGVSLPRRLITPRGVRLAVRKLLAQERYARTAAALASWAAEHDGAATAADALESMVTTAAN